MFKIYSVAGHDSRINQRFRVLEANNMGWITIYIQGKSGCATEVMHNLEHSPIRFMPGSVSGEKNIALVWLDEKVTLRDFKKAIGSKTIFRYRLRFFTSLEKASEFRDQDEQISSEEEPLDMSHWEEQYKHSA